MPSSKLRDLFQAAAKDPGPKEVHQLRTSLRRCEGVITTSTYDLSSNERDTVKRLKKLRKVAGIARDLDIQMSILTDDAFAQPRFNGAPEEFRSSLKASRDKAAKQLAKAIDKAQRKGIAKKIEKLCRNAVRELPANALATVQQQIRDIATQATLEDAEGLHEVRIALKKARYVFEAYEDESLAEIVKAMKIVHDAIGEWHDWLMFADAASDHLSKRSPLALQARRKATQLFVHAVDEATRFLGAYRLERKRPSSVRATGPATSARA